MELVSRIQERLAENKNSVKTYRNYETALSIGNKLGKDYAECHGVLCDDPDFIVVYLPKYERYAVIFQLMSFMQKHRLGGYIGWFAQRGFFSI
jgi:hypothetical protein